MDNRIDINGLSVSYIRQCNTDTPLGTIVFLHGWRGSSKSWELNTAELSKTYDCVCIDLPGFGVSDDPTSVWGVYDYALFLRDFVKVLNVQNFILVGKSFGGRIAIVYAQKWPDTLSHLVLVAAAGIEQKSMLTKIKIKAAKIGKYLLMSQNPTSLEAVRKFFYNTTKITRDQSVYMWEVKKLVTNTDLSLSAESIVTPTLIIWGMSDEVLPIRVGEKLGSLIKGSTFIRIVGGHNAHQESPNEFNTVVKEFLVKKIPAKD